MVKTAASRLGIALPQKKKKGTSKELLGENFGVSGKIFGTEQVKRRASELSPQKDAPSRKRSAFGDITNAVNAAQKLGKTKKSKERSSKTSDKSSIKKKSNDTKIDFVEIFSSSDELLSSQESKESEVESSQEQNEEIIEIVSSPLESREEDGSNDTRTVPDDVTDIDEDTDDPFMSSEYAHEIFQNMKAREKLFPLKSYMDTQEELTISMRAILVDWLVEVQESFELYHETLYVGVKILDHFLMKCPVKREQLQLVGAVSLFISAKVEERHSPCLDDFLYICDDAYQHAEFVAMERKILQTLDFELNIPIPYRFLRRYARAAFTDVKTLTLARFLLESSLHNYQFLEFKPSLIASACLYLALQMQKCGSWTPTLVYYTGYQLQDLKDCVVKLNAMNSEPPKKNLMTVRNKYSHKVFHEVATIPPVDMLLLDFN